MMQDLVTKNLMKRNLLKKKLVAVPLVLIFVALAGPAFGQEQETIAAETDTQQSQREERIQELRQLLREDRAARRETVQSQLDTLTDEQKAALQQRRQMQREARKARLARGSGHNSPNRCQCPEPPNEDADS